MSSPQIILIDVFRQITCNGAVGPEVEQMTLKFSRGASAGRQAHTRHAMRVLLLIAIVFAGTNVFAVDDDLDGMSDVWQRTYQVSPGTADTDTDGDGYANAREASFGANPHLSGLRLTGTEPFMMVLPVFIAGVPHVEWKTVAGIRYQVEMSTDLTNYTVAGVPVVGDGTNARLAFPELAGAIGTHVFRLSALPPYDQDSDGLNAYEEALLGTADTHIDTDEDRISDTAEFRKRLDPTSAVSNDGDAIPDDWEVFHFGDTTPVSAADPENDGFTNLDEFIFNLNPQLDDFGVRRLATHVYTYDDANRLTSVESVIGESFTYDEEGNLTSSR